MNEKEFISTFLKQHRPEFDVDANVNLLLDAATRPLTNKSLAEAVFHVEHKLVLAPEYASAWSEHLLYHEDQNTLAHRRIFLAEMRKNELQKRYVHDYNALVKELGEDLRGLPIEDLREIAATRRENARRKSLDVDELRTLAREERPVPQADELPLTYVPFGKKREVELTAEVLKRAGSRNAELSVRDFKWLVERYGSEAVNQRMNPASMKKYELLPKEVSREQVLQALRTEAARSWVRRFGADQLNKRIFELG